MAELVADQLEHVRMPLTPAGAIGRILLINAAAFVPTLLGIWMGYPKTSPVFAAVLVPAFFIIVRKKRPEWGAMLLGASGLCFGLILAGLAVFIPVQGVLTDITVPNDRAYAMLLAGLSVAGLALIIIGTWVMSREHARGVANSDAPAFN